MKPSAVREQTDGGLNVTKRCTVIYVHSLRRQKTAPEASSNHCQFKVAIFATGVVDFVLWVGSTGNRATICRAVHFLLLFIF